MKIDLLFLTYNRYGLVMRCLSSMIHTLNNKEVSWIILDNASSEQQLPTWLMKLQEKYYPQIKVILSAQNLGVAGGRIELLRHARGDIIGFLDSDVEALHDSWLDSAVKYLSDSPKVGLVGAGGHMLDNQWNAVAVPSNYIGPVHIVSGYSQFFRRRDIMKHRIKIDEGFNFGGVEDDDWCAQFWQAKLEVHQVPLPLKHLWGGTWNRNDGQYLKNRIKLYMKWYTRGVFNVGTKG